MTLDRRIEVLHNAFPAMTDDLLVYVAQNAREVQVAAGDRICAEGERGDAFYIIMTGRAQVSKFLNPSTQQLLTELHAGQFFGELALVDDAPRTASVDALEECHLLVMTKDDFLNLLQDNPALAVPIVHAVAARLRDSDQRTIDELRDKNEQLAKAYAELEYTVKRKSEFLTNVAHELRTPLTSIKGYAHLMRTGMVEGEDLDHAFATIIDNSDAIARLINNILFLQEIELVTPASDPVDMTQLIHSTVDTLWSRAAASGLSFDVSLPADLPRARGDLDSLAQALNALIDNAIKFSPNGGVIKILAESDYDGLLRIAIADQGVGIPADQLYHIFDRYHHIDELDDHLFGGVGLGLPIVKQVIEQHGGNISVVSKIGEGSTFTLTLHVYQEKDKQQNEILV